MGRGFLTMATCGIVEMMFGLREKIAEAAREYLTDELVVVLDKFKGQVSS
jgi:hypothetical protein